MISIRAFAIFAVLPLLAQDDRIYKGVETDTQPKIIHKVEPKYTKQAREEKIEGTVELSIIISAAGMPQRFTVTKTLDPGLDKNAIEAVRHWRFKPATKDGKPVATYATIQMTFHLL